MHIEALFTPAQRVLVAHLHSRDQEERRASSTDPLPQGRQPQGGPLSVSHRGSPTGEDAG